MTATTLCWSSIRGKVMRGTKLDACGAPVVGAKSTLVSNGFVSVALAPQYDDGEDTNLKNANGDIVVDDKADDQLKRYQVEIKLTQVNPDLFSLMTGQAVVLDYLGNATGVRIGQVVHTNFALETWTDLPGFACANGGKYYGYFLVPWLHGARLADFKIENALADFTLQNAITQAGSAWGTGPYDVVMNPGVDSAPAAAGPLLTAIGPQDHLHMEPTTVAPPTPGCAAIALAA